MLRPVAVAAALFSAVSASACTNLIDCRGSGNQSGVWTIAQSPQFPAALIGVTVAGALWEGSESRLGRTLWQSLDASAITGIATFGLKEAFQRARPNQSSSPDQWFSGPKHQSFPSGDVSAIATLVTPFIAEYGGDHPSVWALAALPAFDMAARVQARAHWPTDVIAGAAVGVGGGLLARQLKTPFFVVILPGSVTIGLRTRF